MRESEKKKPPKLSPEELAALPGPAAPPGRAQRPLEPREAFFDPDALPDKLPWQVDPEEIARVDAERAARAAQDAEFMAARLFGSMQDNLTPSQLNDLKRLSAELARRKIEALNLYDPLPMQALFHNSVARIRLLRGSNRGGKTLPAAVEVARAVCGADPGGKYPTKDGRWICVGKDSTHVGQVMWRKLARAGAFKIIRSLKTGLWRAFNPLWGTDMERIEEAKPAPPLIPHRLIKHISWENKKESIPALVTLHNGWELAFYSSLGKPPQGCLAGWSRIYDPVVGEFRRVDEIDGSFHVHSYDSVTGQRKVCRASKPFIKGHGELVEVRFSNGETITVTRAHRLLTTAGEWMTVAEAYEKGVPLRDGGPSPAGGGDDLPHSMSSRTFSQSSLCCAPRTEQQVRQSASDGELWHWNAEDCDDGDDRRLLGTVLGCPGDCYFCPHLCDEQLHRVGVDDQVSSPLQGCVLEHSLNCSLVDDREDRSAHNPVCRAMASVAVDEDAPQNDAGGCYAEQAPERQPWEPCGKSRRFLQSCADRAHRDTAILADQTLSSGNCHPCELEYQLLLASGAAHGSKYGSDSLGNPCHAPHVRRVAEATPHQGTAGTDNDADGSISPCLYIRSVAVIGEGLIWDISVENTMNYYYGGSFSHNSDVDGFWLDEEIVDPDWYPEMSARILDRHGRGIWSATPQAGTDQLYELHERAEEERKKNKPVVEEFITLLSDNPHIPDEDKEDFASALTDEERRVRIGGEFAVTSFKVYPEFSMLIHGEEFREIPPHWCRYAVVDPGHRVCAVLFAAVPPPVEMGDYVYLYDELYIRECDAAKFAEAMYHKTQHQQFQAFLIDPNAAIVTEMGSGHAVGDQYSQELEARQVRSVQTGSRFYMAADDIAAGLLAVHGWLRQREGRQPKLRVLKGALPNFEYEVKRYHKLRVKGEVQDKPDQKRRNHLMDCTRYLAMADPKYIRPPAAKPRPTGAILEFKLKLERKKNRDGDNHYVRLGPGKGA